MKVALLSLKDDKALGPDGFLMKFFNVFWEVINADVI